MTVGRWRSLSIVFLAGLLGLTAAGCLGGASSPSSLSPAKSADRGSSSGFDHHSKRLEVRPQDTSMPVGKQLLMIATVYDENDKPRHHRRIEWTVEGAGNIVEVDESGILTSRGKKVDSKYAITTTDFFDHELPKGVDNPLGQVIRPGQTWCVISSAIEGQTVVTAYAPDIADPERNRVFIKAHWVDARWQFPQPAAAKAGTEFTFATKIDRRSSSEPVANYRVRYTILDEGPAAAVYPVADQRAGTPRSVTVDTDADGVARANVVELEPDFGSNRIGIEVLKLDSTEPGRFVVVAKSETKIDWQAPQVKLNIDAPSTAQLNRAFPITYAVVSSGSLETLPMMLKTVVPPGLEVVSTDPKATPDGNELLWSLPTLPGGKQQSVQAVFRPTKTGNVITTAAVRTNDNLRSESSATVQITEARLDITLSGPRTALVGENVPYSIAVKNTGSGPATNVKVKAQFDAGLSLVGRSGGFETTIDKLEAGQAQSISLPLTPNQAGRSAVKATISADGNLQAETLAYPIDIKKPELKVEAYGPARGYLNQEATWTIRVFNPSELPVSEVKIRANLPKDVTFRKASNDGTYANGTVEWVLGTAVGKQWSDVTVTGVCSSLSAKAVLTATVGGTPLDKRGGEFKPVSMLKPFTADKMAEAAIEILGIPALQMEVFDSVDPAQIGQKVTYTIRVKNGGTLPANRVEVSAELPPQMKPLKAFGNGVGKFDGQRVTFPAIASIQPNAVSVFTIDAEAVSEGDGRFHAELKSLSLGSPIQSEEATRILPKNELPKRGP